MVAASDINQYPHAVLGLLLPSFIGGVGKVQRAQPFWLKMVF